MQSYSLNSRVIQLIKDRHELLWNEPVGARIARPSLSGIGEAVEKAVENIPNIYKSISIDKYVIMPNHIHLILVITNDLGRTMRAPAIATVINQRTRSLPAIFICTQGELRQENLRIARGYLIQAAY